MAHGNEGYRVKHLNGTSGCPHYKGLSAPSDASKKCATNGCQGRAKRACHVINANQNAITGKRKIVYCCPTCNGQKLGQVNNIRKNAETHTLDDCFCGF